MNLPPGFEDLLSQQFAKELAQGMEEMFGGIKAPQGGAGAGADAAGAGAGAGGPPLGGDPNAQLSEEEMMKQFEKIMAEMGLGEGAGAGAGTARTEGAGASGSTSTTTPPAGAAAGSTGTGASTPNFQDAIRSTMSRLRQSEASSSGAGGSGANPFGDFSEADMAKLLEGLGGEGGMPEGEEGMAKMLESMMGELMSKEVLYEPLKELRDKVSGRRSGPVTCIDSADTRLDTLPLPTRLPRLHATPQYPPYLAAPTPNPDGSTPTEEDLTRYRKQYDCVRRVVDLFEDPKYDGGSDAEKKALKEQVGELMNEVSPASSSTVTQPSTPGDRTRAYIDLTSPRCDNRCKKPARPRRRSWATSPLSSRACPDSAREGTVRAVWGPTGSSASSCEGGGCGNKSTAYMRAMDLGLIERRGRPKGIEEEDTCHLTKSRATRTHTGKGEES